MISYQWSHQDAMIQVKNDLEKKGFTIWLDLNDMQGSTLDAMANAVENAYLVLLTVSSSYKASTNCRSGWLKILNEFLFQYFALLNRVR